MADGHGLAPARRRQFELILTDAITRADLLRSDAYIQHGSTTVLQHSIAVAYFSVYLAMWLHVRVNEAQMIRGALLHDYFLYDWHEKDAGHRLHGFRHPAFALRNAMKVYDLTPIERDIIKRHMFPLTPVPPRYRESLLVCLADKICSTYETLNRCSSMKTYTRGRRSLEHCLREIQARE